MYRLEREDFVQSPYISLWATLGFQAGFINAFGFLACGRLVSHVTGVGTQIGTSLAGQSTWVAIELIGFPVFFMLGAFFSSVFTIARIERGKTPKYGLVTFLLPVLLTGILLLGHLGVFSAFGPNVLTRTDFVLLYLLSFICGMQNGCFATLTKGQIRTTHLTGITTDLGTDLGRLYFGRLGPSEKRMTKQMNISRLATFAGFTLGSILSAWSGSALGFYALVVPCVTSLAVWCAVEYIHEMLDSRFGLTGEQSEAVLANDRALPGREYAQSLSTQQRRNDLEL